MNRTFVSLGSGLAFLAVAMGAFGAHAMKGRISEASLAIWQTGAHYHLIHALALVGVGILAAFEKARALTVAGWLFAAGIVLFAGSLYVLAATDIKILGAITPLGGLCFLGGWLTLTVTFARKQG